MVAFYLRAGVNGLTVLGVMGEAGSSRRRNWIAIVQRVIARAENLPIIVGVSAPGFCGDARAQP